MLTYEEAREETNTVQQATQLACDVADYEASGMSEYMDGYGAYLAGIDATDRDSGPFLRGWTKAQADYERQTGNTCNRSIRRSERIGYDESTQPFAY